MALRKRSTIVPIAVGFALYHLAKMPAAFGDLARAQGDASGATQFHLLALVTDLVGLGCFVFALWHIVEHFRGRGDQVPRADGMPLTAERSFDPDAAMARYLTKRSGGAPVAPRGFGRKGA